MTYSYDFSVDHLGTLSVIRPLNPQARDWLVRNTDAEGWQWMGNALAIDPRCAMDVVEGFVADGFDWRRT